MRKGGIDYAKVHSLPPRREGEYLPASSSEIEKQQHQTNVCFLWFKREFLPIPFLDQLYPRVFGVRSVYEHNLGHGVRPCPFLTFDGPGRKSGQPAYNINILILCSFFSFDFSRPCISISLRRQEYMDPQDNYSASEQGCIEGHGDEPLITAVSSVEEQDQVQDGDQNQDLKRNQNNDSSNKEGPISPEVNANILSLWTMWWINGLFRTGYKRQIQEDDLYQLLDQRKAHILGGLLLGHWEEEKARAKGKNRIPSLLRALVKSFWRRYLPGYICLEIGGTIFFLKKS